MTPRRDRKRSDPADQGAMRTKNAPPAPELDRELLFHQSFLQANEPMMICDEQSRLLFVNKAFTAVYGYTAEEATGRSMAILHPRGSKKSHYRQPWGAAQALSDGPWRGELQHRTKDNAPLDVEMTVTSILDGEGHRAASLCVAVDITDRKLMESNLGRREKLSSIGLLASGIAHEIGSPLNVISGRAEMVKGLIEKEVPEAAGALNIIVQQTDRISELIKALLNFSHPGPRRSIGNFSEIDLMEVLEETRKLLRKPLTDLGAQFVVKSRGPTRVVWDFQKAEQVFINLLQNALHAVEGKPDGGIEVKFRTLSGAETRDAAFAPGTGLAVEISDNGSGIPERYLTRIFDPFFTTKEVGMGTGLGLSVVYGLLREVQGEVQVESTVNEATRFTLVLPTV